MNLTKDQTFTVIMALKEYQGLFYYKKDPDLWDDIEKLIKHYEKSLKCLHLQGLGAYRERRKCDGL
tara:strand:- start:131 stop:328 length:198 start_codon:yes stop_codon:yes gene_type:complete